MTAVYHFLHVDAAGLSDDDTQALSERLFAMGATGVETRDGHTLNASDAGEGATLVAHFEDGDALNIARVILQGEFPVAVQTLEGDGWRDEWKRFFKPCRVSQRFLIRPSWEQAKELPGDLVIVMDPGRAFGTGTHATTQLVLREVDRRMRGGEQVIDVGCGSGILSVGAALAGASQVYGTDVDVDVIPVCKENARRAGVEDMTDFRAPGDEWYGDRYDVVLANIESRVLIPMAETLSRMVAPDGWMTLSGVLRTEGEEVAKVFAPLMGRPWVTLQGEWVALTFTA